MKLTGMMKWDERTQAYVDPYLGDTVKVPRQNWVFAAVQILGGLEAATQVLHRPRETILAWIEQGHTDDTFEARTLENRTRLPRGVVPASVPTTQV